MHVEHPALPVGQGGAHIHAVEALLAAVRAREADVTGPAPLCPLEGAVGQTGWRPCPFRSTGSRSPPCLTPWRPRGSEAWAAPQYRQNPY